MRFQLPIVVFLFSLSACTSAPIAGVGYSPKQLFQYACEVGGHIHSAKGAISLKAESSEFTGQVPAQIQVVMPDQLRLEVNNLFGGTEALIWVSGNHYEIIRNGKEKKQEGYDSWGGIPLRWATDLFIGKIPCPMLTESTQLSVNLEGELTVVVAAGPKTDPQKFVYRFEKYANQPWPQSLHWDRLGLQNVSVDFKFSNPEEVTLSPMTWVATSAHGKVKARWRERKIIGIP